MENATDFEIARVIENLRALLLTNSSKSPEEMNVTKPKSSSLSAVFPINFAILCMFQEEAVRRGMDVSKIPGFDFVKEFG